MVIKFSLNELKFMCTNRIIHKKNFVIIFDIFVFVKLFYFIFTSQPHSFNCVYSILIALNK